MDHFEDFAHFLLAVYQYLMLPVFLFVLRPIFLGINRVLGCIPWLYGFRVTLMVQGLLCYWRAFLYFERSILWEKLVENHEHHGKSYIIPVFWTINGSFIIFIILIVLVTTLAGEENVRTTFNIQGRVGFSFYCLGKSSGELLILNLMVFVGDHVADKSVVEMDIAACFVCGYLSLVSLMKLCYVGNDLGLVDGIASVIVCIATHYCKTGTERVVGTLGCWSLVLVKNILLTDCCRPCSEAAIIGLPVGDGGGGAAGGGPGGGGGAAGGGPGGGGGAAGGGPGGGGAAGGGPGGGGAADGGPGDGQTEVFHSARTSSATSV